uniref:dUTP diphosphatase n=1 Tax=Rhinella marina erythrocytic-like virus TaxID=2859906 RepID=A0A8F6YJS3_9VIRU|nr:dUTPase [Rhinella marina erythrocytic-like virus]
MSNILYFQYSKCTAPQRSATKAAGIDIASPIDITINPFKCVKIDLEICVKIPTGHYGRLALRSSIAAKGLVLSGGVIDEDYTGSLKAVIINPTDTPVNIAKNDRIVQIICEKCSLPELVNVTSDYWITVVSQSERKDSGFGSTGT